MLCPGCGTSMDRELTRSLTVVLIDDETPPEVQESDVDQVEYTCPSCGHVETVAKE